MKRYIGGITVALVAATLAAGCASGDKLVSSEQPTIGTPLLARYVSMGNSITAGMQSAGINDSTQRRAYPVLLAKMANVPFIYPSLGPGCPAPFTVPLGPTRTVSIPGGCALRQSFTGLVNNVAVPNEYVSDLTDPRSPGAANALSTFINGGLTEVQAMQAQNPTFVSLWAPNNDVLSAVNLGDTTAAVLTPLATYTTAFNNAVAAIKAVPALKGAVLIGVVDVPQFAPIVQPGAFFFGAWFNAVSAGQPSPFGKPVDQSCSPFTGTGQPNALGGNLVSFQAVADTSVHAITCLPNAKWVTSTSVGGALGGTPEINVFETRIAAINAAVKAAADANGWIYVDPNTQVLGATALQNTTYFKKCQGLRTATDLASFAAAIAATCPGNPSNYFGTMVSLDATHPSTAFHQAMASYLAQAINTKYQTSITTNVPTPAVVAR